MNFDYVDIKVCGNSAMPRINITTIIKFPSSTVKLAQKKKYYTAAGRKRQIQTECGR